MKTLLLSYCCCSEPFKGNNVILAFIIEMLFPDEYKMDFSKVG